MTLPESLVYSLIQIFHMKPPNTMLKKCQSNKKQLTLAALAHAHSPAQVRLAQEWWVAAGREKDVNHTVSCLIQHTECWPITYNTRTFLSCDQMDTEPKKNLNSVSYLLLFPQR